MTRLNLTEEQQENRRLHEIDSFVEMYKDENIKLDDRIEEIYKQLDEDIVDPMDTYDMNCIFIITMLEEKVEILEKKLRKAAI